MEEYVFEYGLSRKFSNSGLSKGEIWGFNEWFSIYPRDTLCIGVWQRVYKVYEPRHEKTCLRGLRPGKSQTGLLSYRSQRES